MTKFIVNAPDGYTEADIAGVLRGYAAATGAGVADVKELIATKRWKGGDGVDFAFGLLIAPMERIDSVTLIRPDGGVDGGTAQFKVEVSAKEYAILNYLVSHLNPPF